jgi:glycosyltransferase involved in cell wall biosynthesis
MRLPKVTVVIANYNYGEYVVDAINSAINQTYPQTRVVVVDDGSNDFSVNNIFNAFKKRFAISTADTVDLPYYKGVRTITAGDDKLDFIMINNSGASTARNVGIHHAWADTDIFAILDADDTYLPTKVEKLVEKLVQHKEIGVAYADYQIVRTGDKEYVKTEFKQPYGQLALRQECIVHSGALIKKEFLEAVKLPNDEFYNSKLHGPASRGFIGCTEDYDLWLRLSNQCLMTHVPEVLSIVRETGKNQSMKMTPEIFRQNMKVINGQN